VLQTLLVAGNVTTTSLILETVRQRAMGAVGTAEQLVEEALRYEAPAQVFYRIATADATIGDSPIESGEVVAVLYGSANRDPDVFPEADDFCPAREQRPQHLAFGHGIHACLGAALARLEASIVLDLLEHRLPGLRLAGEWRPRHGDSMSLRGLATLDIEWDAQPRARN
jgi:cytochrome P450